MQDPFLKLSQDQFESIERYLQGKMSADELAAVNRKIEKDSVFRTQVEEVRVLIQASEEMALRGKLDTFHQDLQPRQDNSKALNKPRSLNRYLVAAAIAVCAVASIWAFLAQQEKKEELFSQFYVPDPGLITQMSSQGPYEFNKGMVAYKAENYSSAIETWEPLLAQKPLNDTLQYFLGSAHLAKLESKEAIPYFEHVISQEKSPFYAEGLWYLSLAFVQEKNVKKAREYLERCTHPKKQALLSLLKQDM